MLLGSQGRFCSSPHPTARAGGHEEPGGDTAGRADPDWDMVGTFRDMAGTFRDMV